MYSPYLIFSIYSFGGAWQLKWAGKDCWSAAFRHFAGDIVTFPDMQMAIAANHTPLRAWRTSLPFTLFTFQYWIQNQLIFMHDLSTSWCIILLDTASKWLKLSVSGTFAGEKRSIGLLATCEGVARIWRCWSGRRKTGRRKWSQVKWTQILWREEGKFKHVESALLHPWRTPVASEFWWATVSSSFLQGGLGSCSILPLASLFHEVPSFWNLT